MAEITYLLGAGASANAIPVVKEIVGFYSDYITALHNFFQNENFQKELLQRQIANNPTTLNKMVQDFINLNTALNDNISKHVSFDTYAKKIWLDKKSDEFLK